MPLLLPSPDPSLPQDVQDELSSSYAAIQTAYTQLAQAQVTGAWIRPTFNPADYYMEGDGNSWTVAITPFAIANAPLSYAMLTPQTMLLNLHIAGVINKVVDVPYLHVRIPDGYICGNSGNPLEYFTGMCWLTVGSDDKVGVFESVKGRNYVSIHGVPFFSFPNGGCGVHGQLALCVTPPQTT